MIVVDASVGLKWLKHSEPDASQALKLYTNHIEGRQKIIVPSLFFLEIANVLATSKDISKNTIQKSVNHINEIGLSIHSFSKKDLMDSALLAKKYQTTIYDMLYAVTAKAEKCHLITADKKFVQKTRFPFVKLLQSLK